MSTNGTTDTKNTSGILVYKSRWGWHPGDYATFLEVKEYHKLMLRDFRATRRADHYYAKLEKNRKGPKPFAGLGTSKEAYIWVLQEYRALRRPKTTPDEVASLDLPRSWRNDLDQLRRHYTGVVELAKVKV